MAGCGAGVVLQVPEEAAALRNDRSDVLRRASTATGDGLDLGGIRGYTAASSASAAPSPHRPPASRFLLLLSVLQLSRENISIAIVKIVGGNLALVTGDQD
ncbi:hypothetical protein EJB05_00956 [Eragrostis curvula]|uniref:Uncharacterized protein n=1 Tax=Eragrostis curvula TaxID=38414 RepID=A0A5J9WNV5_9POAL|nr:hypothetical protein EJB05_00956 [Eragrostis curvula]